MNKKPKINVNEVQHCLLAYVQSAVYHSLQCLPFITSYTLTPQFQLHIIITGLYFTLIKITFLWPACGEHQQCQDISVPRGNPLMTERLSSNYQFSCLITWDTFALLLRVSHLSNAQNNSMLKKVLRCLTLLLVFKTGNDS